MRRNKFLHLDPQNQDIKMDEKLAHKQEMEMRVSEIVVDVEWKNSL